MEAGARVTVVGQGYVGLPLAMRAVEIGHDVVGYDVDEHRVKMLADARTYVDDVSDADLESALATGRYHPSTNEDDLSGFDVAVITVPTPLREGAPDLTYVDRAAATLGRHLRPGATVILESTTYPGTTEERLRPVLEETSGLRAGADFHLGYSPERIDPGNREFTFVNTPKVVAGIDPASTEAVRAFYDRLVERTVVLPSARAAELTKLVENTFRHVNIALVNELAMFANDLDIDIWSVIDAAATKPFGFMRFTPGPGVGGHCLPIDPSYLSWQVKRRLGSTFRFVELANDINEHMPSYVVRRITESLNRRRLPVNGSRILLLGLSYKRNSGDARESPAIPIARQLDGLGAHVRAADPHVNEHIVDCPAVRVDATVAEIEAADLVVLVTDHDDFPYEAVASHAKAVFDTRHRLRGPNVEHL
ncbi:MAG: nucleotide sugar dehydrogenase [Deltaproteobacteria bacterium]|nr:MAG: nucleotide sugar dehydrogenase [Deltaproteobacteria bacterium]